MKLTHKLLCLLLALSCHAVSAANTLHSMTREQVKQAFIHKTLVSIPTDNLNGKTINNSFTMFMDDNGKIYGEMSLQPDNEPKTDQGVYSLEKDGAVAITWDHWDKQEKLFAQFYETENAYLAIGRDNVFHTVFMKEAILPGNQLKMSAR